MPKQHEILAVGLGKKAEAERVMTDAYHLIKKEELFDGFRKTYRPLDEVTGEKLASEVKNAQHRLPEVVSTVAKKLVELFDVTLTMDVGNQIAKAAVDVEGGPKFADIPVPTLLFLEKQLENLKTFVQTLPTPDAAEVWHQDVNQGLLATHPTDSHRTKKTQRAIVRYPATVEHPAQTEMISEDVLAGYWTTIKYTSRVPANVKAKMLERVVQLQDAVKVARERANSVEVTRRKVGDDMLAFVFGDYLK